MALVKTKPTSAGRRFVVKVVTPGLHKGEPHAPLLEKKIRGFPRFKKRFGFVERCLG